MVADPVAGSGDAGYEPRALRRAGLGPEDKERRQEVMIPKDLEDFGRSLGIRSIVEGQRDSHVVILVPQASFQPLAEKIEGSPGP